MSLALFLIYLFYGSVFEHLFRDGVGEGAVRVHLQQGKSETQAKLLQVLLCLAFILDLDAFQNSTTGYVSLLLVVEFVEQVVAYLVLNATNGNVATDACFGTYMEVFLGCL
jgi:hypothetical protein